MPKTIINTLFAITCLLILQGCASVTINYDDEPEFSWTPHYEARKDFYALGLIGEHRVNVEKVCRGRGVIQVQSTFTATDVLYGILTLGIYMPRTAKVWCVRKD